MISIVIPVSNLEEYTNECIDNLFTYSHETPEIIVVDNASTEPYKRDGVKTIRNDVNKGFWPSLLAGMSAAKNDVVLCMHNDVFIWEAGFDQRLETHFDQDDKLAITGFFGARGLAVNGARMFPESNMVAQKYGTHGNLHGNLLLRSHPSVIFDSLSMCFRKSHLAQIDYINIPPHHWTDRIVTLRLLVAGYHARTVGIAFDHGGGFTSSTPAMGNFTERWCREHNLEQLPGETWDNVLYRVGNAIFAQEFLAFTKGKNELWVQSDYSLQTR
jgi:glycosyltransferase involved in cell wall biosynthesis